MANTCSDCGANLALVGFRHRCVSRAEAKKPDQHPGLQGANIAVTDRATVVVAKGTVGTDASPANSTYQYRDPEKRRAYMADYMRKRRGVR